MEIEKTLVLAAPVQRVWDVLLDPVVMGECVPGMQSIEVLSPTEYLAVMQVKISFVSAKFKIKTNIAEMRPPHYLRSVGTGDDRSVASSFKQSSEINLTTLDNGDTQVHMHIKVDVLGKLGSFGLSAMKTKSDVMWDAFGENLRAKLAPENPTPLANGQPAAPTSAAASNPATEAPAPWWRRFWAMLFGRR